jgi:hypothetical protein
VPRLRCQSKTALDRLYTYGKWLFGSATIVGTLGASLSNSAFSKLHGIAAWLFAGAVLSLGAGPKQFDHSGSKRSS